MKKTTFKKVLYTLMVIGILAFSVCEFVFPTQTQEVVNIFWKWVNQPLPIVGFSLVGVSVFLYKVISMTTVGNAKIKKFKELYEQAQREAEERENGLIKQNNKLEKDNDFLLTKVTEMCSCTRNVKVQQIGKEIESYAKERTNN